MVTPPLPGRNRRARLGVIVVTDVLVIAELFVAMYFANANPEQFTFVFLRVFFGLLIPTLVAAWVVLRRMLQ